MIKLLKVLFIVNFITSNKKALFYIVLLIALFLTLPYFFDDIFQFTSQKDKAFWVFVKWFMLTSLFTVILFKCYKTFNQPALKLTAFLDKTAAENTYKDVTSQQVLSKGDKIKNKHRVKQ